MLTIRSHLQSITTTAHQLAKRSKFCIVFVLLAVQVCTTARADVAVSYPVKLTAPELKALEDQTCIKPYNVGAELVEVNSADKFFMAGKSTASIYATVVCKSHQTSGVGPLHSRVSCQAKQDITTTPARMIWSCTPQQRVQVSIRGKSLALPLGKFTPEYVFAAMQAVADSDLPEEVSLDMLLASSCAFSPHINTEHSKEDNKDAALIVCHHGNGKDKVGHYYVFVATLSYSSEISDERKFSVKYLRSYGVAC